MSNHLNVPNDFELRSFGRRRGRTLSPRQQSLLSELLPKVSLRAQLKTEQKYASTWLEIGFGGGEHLVWQAVHNPTVMLWGCEPFEDGVVKVLAAIEERKLPNISVHDDDARDIIRLIPAKTIDRVFILFPDPWPKRKHHKRRLINSRLLQELAHVMTQGAELRIGTDIDDYARTILMAFQQEPSFIWQAARSTDWLLRPSDWPQTRYEAKAIREGRRSVYLCFNRR